MVKHPYLLRIAIAIDDLVNAILDGDPQETMSSRMGKNLNKPGHWISKFV